MVGWWFVGLLGWWGEGVEGVELVEGVEEAEVVEGVVEDESTVVTHTITSLLILRSSSFSTSE